ncbi:L-serine ammonia-lyase, iron-sulfur-dependent, subunit alpha [Clostridium luticellarii]|jgi:L-serine dehydratase|uniref:L-serine dehydratase n=1 Tax=Clostridium luticellarii TaxID=1691940 RepID=A0A2T0BMQ6_9CLOT|nr:L-serine ammonia-lyase, iron-sulfur-dependent, subunit alpha [Clostridium luticellarii]MCI1946480.1 L-serine ammonia-lyase, iron-sulfur-dependent, subunit alpha [Clostridium luticellarii]MCI1969699.1 L-serine ammonia-lyase, iron-sulfur-dependent, subunit alpha [Clostridium luticellarii]MCI1996338.1 L-serine ammonia-lyase, iron-sulfur-dependent, subunit alpha [Clostridium luticellarii]MCI2040665.1 L-serine ammonia-lyase, iron-sulfur-dependent, subunit alpha [Clostridium luticellarii]PRR85146
MYESIKEIVDTANEKQVPIYELAIKQEMEITKSTFNEIWDKMSKSLETMANDAEKSIEKDGVFSPTGLTGGDAVKIKQYRESGKTLSGDMMMRGVQSAIGTNEVNAAMGVICATPTAGASGTIPGVLFTIKKVLQLNRDEQIHFLFTSALFGMIVANNACIAGASGGCQAEVGSASAMAAAAAVEAAGGTPEQCDYAFSTALQNLLGLVCDPVAGLVEIPCVKRNAIGTANALVAADLALAGVNNLISSDEVIEAMYRVGKQMPRELRETGLGGVAATPTGIAIRNRIFGKQL